MEPVVSKTVGKRVRDGLWENVARHMGGVVTPQTTAGKDANLDLVTEEKHLDLVLRKLQLRVVESLISLVNRVSRQCTQV
jgi:hypothetical protein